MKVYKVTQETKIINYQPAEESYAHLYTNIDENYRHGVKFEKMFLSKENADTVYNEILDEIMTESDGIIKSGNTIYYVKNVWELNKHPYSIISCACVQEVEVAE